MLCFLMLLPAMPSGFAMGPELIPPIAEFRQDFLIPPAKGENANDFWTYIPIEGPDNIQVKVTFHGVNKNGKALSSVHPKMLFELTNGAKYQQYSELFDSSPWTTSQPPTAYNRMIGNPWDFSFERADHQPYWLKATVTIATSERKKVLKNIRSAKGFAFEAHFKADGAGIYMIEGGYGYVVGPVEKWIPSEASLGTEGKSFFSYKSNGEQAALLKVTPEGAAKARDVTVKMSTDKRDVPATHTLRVTFYTYPNTSVWQYQYRNNPPPPPQPPK